MQYVADYSSVACRIFLSSRLASCLQFYNEPEKEESIPALLHIPMRMGRKINEGFKAALKASGIQVNEYRIEEKLQFSAEMPYPSSRIIPAS